MNGLMTLALAPTGDASFLVNLAVILVSSTVVALVFQRMKLAVIPAYLISGILIGPGVLDLVKSTSALESISQFAIILLLFGIGLELNLAVLRSALIRLVATGMVAVALTVVAGWPLAMAAGLSPPSALVVSMALSLSSTAVVLRLLAQRREMRHARGQLSFAILVVQDILVLGMLALIPALVAWAVSRGDPNVVAIVTVSDEAALHFMLKALIRIGGAGALMWAGWFLLPRLMTESLRRRSLQVMMLAGVAAALVTAEIAQLLGFSVEMGAFLAGFILAGTPFRHQLSAQIGPLRDLFIAVFFTVLGMEMRPMGVLDSWWVIVVAVLVMIVLKTTITSLVCWLLGSAPGTAIAVGLFLAQAGEFGLILFATAADRGLIDQQTKDVLIPVVIVSLIVTPWLVQMGDYISRRMTPFAASPGRPTESGNWTAPVSVEPAAEKVLHVVVAGFGPVGRFVVENLEKELVECTVIELNPETVREESARGRRILFGDAANEEILESAGLAHADAFVLTIPDEVSVMKSCAAARQMAPEAVIIARSNTYRHQREIEQSGADAVIVEEEEASRAMLRAVLQEIL